MARTVCFLGFDKKRSFTTPKDIRPGLDCDAKAFPKGLFSRLLWPFVRFTIDVKVEEVAADD